MCCANDRQRFAALPLKEFVCGKGELSKMVELLLLRSNEMDEAFESNPETAPMHISRTLQQVQAAVRKLRAIGFHEALILTDTASIATP